MRGLVVKILRGIYPPIPSQFSRDVRDLVASMLSKARVYIADVEVTLCSQDPRRRPTIGAILKKSFIRERISKFLSQTVRMDEFAHTMLHRPSPGTSFWVWVCAEHLFAAINVQRLKEKPAEILKRLKEAHRRREEKESQGGAGEQGVSEMTAVIQGVLACAYPSFVSMCDCLCRPECVAG